MLTTLLESGAKPYSSPKGVAISVLLHGALIGAAIFATSRVVLPPREKVEEHPVLYVATPPPPAITPPPAPLPAVKTPPKAKTPEKVFKAPPQRAPTPPAPRPVAPVPPKGPATPALTPPTRVALSLPPINPNATPTVSDVVAPPVAPPASTGSGVPTTGSVTRTDDGDTESKGGLTSGSSGKAFDEFQVDKTVEERSKPQPRYPESLKSVGVEGVVVMRYIVSAEGRVEPGSIEVVDSPNKLFSEAVRSALLNARYRPAEAGGRAVRQLVEQAFTFKLSKG